MKIGTVSCHTWHNINVLTETNFEPGGFSKEEFLVYCKVNGVDDAAAINKFYEFDSDGDSGIGRNGKHGVSLDVNWNW